MFIQYGCMPGCVFIPVFSYLAPFCRALPTFNNEAGLNNKQEAQRAVQPIHVMCLEMMVVLCLCLCCYPSVCIQHCRADPLRDKRETVS